MRMPRSSRYGPRPISSVTIDFDFVSPVIPLRAQRSAIYRFASSALVLS